MTIVVVWIECWVRARDTPACHTCLRRENYVQFLFCLIPGLTSSWFSFLIFLSVFGEMICCSSVCCVHGGFHSSDMSPFVLCIASHADDECLIITLFWERLTSESTWLWSCVRACECVSHIHAGAAGAGPGHADSIYALHHEFMIYEKWKDLWHLNVFVSFNVVSTVVVVLFPAIEVALMPIYSVCVCVCVHHPFAFSRRIVSGAAATSSSAPVHLVRMETFPPNLAMSLLPPLVDWLPFVWCALYALWLNYSASQWPRACVCAFFSHLANRKK